MKKLINLKSVSFLASFAFIFLIFSCSKEDSIQNESQKAYNILMNELGYSANNEHIKFVSTNGRIDLTYFYDNTGKIMEENSLLWFKKYIYDENGRLLKTESAMDRSIFSSTYTAPRTEFMTSKNSVADRYSLYEYDMYGRLLKIENYFNVTGNGFEYRSMQTFEYDGSYVIKVNTHAQEGHITQFRVYTYDNHGNVANEKNYSNQIYQDELMNETSYKYDNYKNPYRIFRILGSPGLYTNVNNIIETRITRHYEATGLSKYETNNSTYQYNMNGYPVNVKERGSVFDYNYGSQNSVISD